MTILLTSATYKLFVSTSLPAIAYLTMCDRYLLCCFILQALTVAMLVRGVCRVQCAVDDEERVVYVPDLMMYI